MLVSNWGGKMGDGVDSYGKWWNVGLHKLSANLRVAQATLAKPLLHLWSLGLFSLKVTTDVLPNI